MSSSTNSLERRACSACSSNASRRRLLAIRSAFSTDSSSEPHSLIRETAPFIPIPGTPGTLSTLSPTNPKTSVTFSGGTPNFSVTPGGS